ncbi:MAG: aminotransferase class I/II-fold pyridoxal phosphate-dependent enzyme, partial [Deltaproteobacteria bacterium]|nr:aminotransferase class I/II-fold pyridoxal phosphate-dependent enzyme [Deltaproteobacteria bacterium]
MKDEAEKIPFHQSWIGDEEIREVTDTLESGWITTGPRTRAFEEAFAAYHGAKHAVGVTSCTNALHLSLLACGVKAGDEVITTPMTWCSTANVVEWIGARPVFVDVHPTRRTIDPQAIEAAITERTRAIIHVHFA